MSTLRSADGRPLRASELFSHQMDTRLTRWQPHGAGFQPEGQRTDPRRWQTNLVRSGEAEMRGRRPKPTRLKALTGNPGKRPLNPAELCPEPAVPECPAELGPVARNE